MHVYIYILLYPYGFHYIQKRFWYRPWLFKWGFAQNSHNWLLNDAPNKQRGGFKNHQGSHYSHVIGTALQDGAP